MAEIILATVNAKYIHPSLGLRSLRANLGEFQPRSRILEFNLEHSPEQIAEAILALEPTLVGLGVYVWNVRRIEALAVRLKSLRRDLLLVLGGPEVSHTREDIPLTRAADFIIQGEAELRFAALCSEVLAGNRPAERWISAEPPPLAQLASPYPEYSEHDLRNRLTYVEASRGCPFRCEFCLSSLDKQVRSFPLDPFLAQLQQLLERGARRFKFVDRTFNLARGHWEPILRFFHARLCPGLFLHFEIVPDRVPEELLDLVRLFPPEVIQFEVGIQTFNPEVAERIHRKQDFERTEACLRRLRTSTPVHLHADLIAGLPGETLESFAAGFDRLYRLDPQEIQVGILKRLKGAPISRHDSPHRMRYSVEAPYEILSNDCLDEATLLRVRRFASFWERFHNSGEFADSLRLLLGGDSPFGAFLQFSEWLFARLQRTHSIPLELLAESLLIYLHEVRGVDHARAKESVLSDYLRTPGRRPPLFAKAQPDSRPRQ